MTSRYIRLTRLLSCSMIAVLLTSGAHLSAEVRVDEYGIGFIGKGDVQSAFGWSNAQLQANAANLIFRLSEEQTANWMCLMTTPNDKHQWTKEFERSVDLKGTIAFDPRKNARGQITGFNLNGFVTNPEAQKKGVGDCGPLGELVGTVNLDGDTLPSLQVSDGTGTWYDLPLTLVD
jgi:hypothetical protein